MAFCLFANLHRNKGRSLERQSPDGKTAQLAEKPVDEALHMAPVSTAVPLNGVGNPGHTLDAYTAVPTQKTEQLLEFHIDDDKDSKIDLGAAMRAVDVALNGLEIGGKRQGTPPPSSRPETVPVSQPQGRSRPGFPPKAVLPKAIRRFAKFVAPQQRTSPDTLAMQQQGTQLPYQQQRSSSSDFLLNSGDLLNPQLAGYFPNGMEMRSNYSESDIQNALWGSQGGEGWNIQQLQSIMNQQQQPGLVAHNGVSRHMSADFSNNSHIQKYAMDNAIAEFLMNSDSWSSKIEAPKHGGRGDSFSSKIEFPVSCDSFTSKMSGASVREDSFSSQQQPFWPRGIEQRTAVSDALMDTAFSIPESIVQELECMAEGEAIKEMPEPKPVIQADPRSNSEQDILFAITEMLLRAVENTLCHDDLASDLNFLTITVRRHLMDHQNFSSSAAEKFLLVGSTIPVICRTAMFNSHVISLLKRFMDIISSGHPLLNNAGTVVTPAVTVDLQKQNEARHVLTRVYRSLTGAQATDPTVNAGSHDSQDVQTHISEPTTLKNTAPEAAFSESASPSPDTVDAGCSKCMKSFGDEIMG